MRGLSRHLHLVHGEKNSITYIFDKKIHRRMVAMTVNNSGRGGNVLWHSSRMGQMCLCTLEIVLRLCLHQIISAYLDTTNHHEFRPSPAPMPAPVPF